MTALIVTSWAVTLNHSNMAPLLLVFSIPVAVVYLAILLVIDAKVKRRARRS
jgi:hypothetical protein